MSDLLEFDNINQTFFENDENMDELTIETPFEDEINKIDISINILLEFQDYCRSQGLSLCEKLNSEDLLDLII